MENKLPESTDKELRMKVVEIVLEFHKDKGADTKRIKSDIEMVYAFLKEFTL
jgi:hypothetical protein